MKQLERENVVKGSGPAALGRINRNQFDEVMVDLRLRRHQGSNEIHGIGDVLPGLIGKMLTVTIEVNGPKTLLLVERYLLNRLPQPLVWLICHP